MRSSRIIAVVLLATALVVSRPSAQSLTFISLFERYLESLRVEANVPGVSAAVIQNGQVWERGFGRQDVDGALPATPDTPYHLGDASQVLGATLLLRKCVDQSHLELSDRVTRWVSSYSDADTTVRQLLGHIRPGGGFQYGRSRFAALTGVIEECAEARYAPLLASEIFDRLGMERSVPGQAVAVSGSADRALFSSSTIARYEQVLRSLAVPYRVDKATGRATRSELPTGSVDASWGAITSARDLARFDLALRAGALVSPSTQQSAWTPTRSDESMAGGWFVQSYRGERLVWHFGLVRDAYSSLYLKLPGRDLTLILLANSDGLSAPFSLENGDITASIFARLFLQLVIT